MRHRLSRTLVHLLWVGICIATPCVATTSPQAGGALTPQELRERWASKSPEERSVLRERFELLRAMEPEARERMQQRALNLRRLESNLRRQASEQDRRRVDAMSPRDAREHWRERTHEHERELGRSIRENLPPAVRERLERMPPSERRAYLEGLRHGARESKSLRAVRDMGMRLGLSEAEIRRHQALPVEQRLALLLSLQRRAITRRMEEHGIPPRLDEATWRRVQELPDEEFVRTMRLHFPRPQDRPGASPGRRAHPLRGRRGDTPGSTREGNRRRRSNGEGLDR